MLILGIETSCDETAVGIVDEDRRILANCVASQMEEHKPFGGVVPEIAARAHLAHTHELVCLALEESGTKLENISGIAATCGPGLIGGVMVGAMMGKALAAARNLPFVAVNHLEAHGLTARLTHGAEFPYLLLLVSGGHCQILLVRGIGDFRCLGTTLDDAVGECFDKSAKLLGLGYPGGPEIERAAVSGNPKAFNFPRPLIARPGCNFSFSGLKTAVRQLTETQTLSQRFVADVAASLQAAIADILSNRVQHAIETLQREKAPVTSLVLGGGVAANQCLRAALNNIVSSSGLSCLVPPANLCTDNGVMVAWAGLERLRIGLTDGYDVASRPRWPLESLRAIST